MELDCYTKHLICCGIKLGVPFKVKLSLVLCSVAPSVI